jgi:mycobactin peptide synthetase MbtE
VVPDLQGAPSPKSIGLIMTILHTLDLNAYVSADVASAVAVEQGDRKLTYAQLLDCVQKRAVEIGHVASAHDVVSLSKPRSIEYLIDLLSILHLGAIAMPIDPSYPAARRKAMFDCVPAQVALGSGSDQVLNVESNLSGSEHGAEQPAYIMFTSGSTGHPKAILGSLTGLVNFIRWQGAEFAVETGDRVSFLTPIGFDVSLRDILLPLLHGATLVIPNDEDITSPLRITQWLFEKDISIMHTVPSVAKIWARTTEQTLPSLRLCFLAGEKLYPANVAILRGAFGEHVEYVNLYGPTETTLAKFFHRIDQISEQDDGTLPVGHPIPGASFELRGGDRKGEVVIKTPDASLGYIGAGQSDLDRFSSDETGRTCYCTGDLGERREDGSLVIVGRVDDEVKVNGVRVHPNEVTHTLGGYEGAQDVVVIAKDKDSSDPRLAVFWVPAALTPEADEADFRSFSMSQLPRVIVPTIWRKLEVLPQNANGKVDTRALLEMLTHDTATVRAPTTSTEVWLAHTISSIIDTPVNNIGADLFGLGATSIHVAFLIGQIEAEMGKVLDFADLFSASTLADIAGLIDAAPRNEPVAIPVLTPAKTYRMSPQQRRWWNIYMPRGNRSWATMVRLIEFDVTLDAQRLHDALFALVERYDSLRMTFEHQENEVVLTEPEGQDFADFPIQTLDLSGCTSKEANIALNEARLDVANSEIATGEWPLFRVKLVQMPMGRSTLVFAIHHMVSDGFSMNLIDEQLRNLVSDAPTVLPPLPYDYRAYADWSCDIEKNQCGAASKAAAYWSSVFERPYHKHIFPEKWTGPDHDRGQGYCIQVPDDVRIAVQEYARANRVTEFSVYFSAKLRALHRLTKRDDLVVGTPAAGRETKGSEALVGNFISLVTVRSVSPERSSALEHVKATMQSVAKAMTHQSYQYDTLVKQLGMNFEQARFPLTTMFISYLNFSGAGGSGFDPNETGFSDLGFAVKFDLMSYIREHNKATSLLLQYRNNLFDKPEISRFADMWLTELRAIVLPVSTDHRQSYDTALYLDPVVGE